MRDARSSQEANGSRSSSCLDRSNTPVTEEEARARAEEYDKRAAVGPPTVTAHPKVGSDASVVTVRKGSQDRAELIRKAELTTTMHQNLPFVLLVLMLLKRTV